MWKKGSWNNSLLVKPGLVPLVIGERLKLWGINLENWIFQTK